MDIKEIRELASLMGEMGLTALEYRSGGESVRLKRPEVTSPAEDARATTAYIAPQDEEYDSAGIITVKSPMVGVFYSAPGADEKPFVAVGDTVSAGDVLCVIEAMKIMNEITAERDGNITEICAENKQVVEFGQPLFRINAAESDR